MYKKIILSAFFSGALLGINAQSSLPMQWIYSAKLQNSTSSVQQISDYLKNICSADSVIYKQDNTYFIYTKLVLNENIVSGKLQKNYTPLSSLKLNNPVTVAAETDPSDKYGYEIINELETIHDVNGNDFATAKTITFNFAPAGREKYHEIQAKIADVMNKHGQKMQLVSLEDGAISINYINQSPKEIMMLFNENELPELNYDLNGTKYKLVGNLINIVE